MDYAVHYRSPHMIGIDADYRMSRIYMARGWPTFLVVDTEGVIRFHGFPSDQELSQLRECVEELAGKQGLEAGRDFLLDDGVAYPREAHASRQAARERGPRLALDSEGNPHVVYYSNREGTNGVYLRRYNPKGDSPVTSRLSAPALESYAPDCDFDGNDTLWIAWCGRKKGLFDVYAQARREGTPAATHQVTTAPDDSMRPRIAAAPDGSAVVTYYTWRMLWGTSRDRDVFASVYDPAGQCWSKPVEISPHQPEVEDHTDPDVVTDPKGKAWIVWSFDYHPSLYKGQKTFDAAQPTVFAARLGSESASAPLLVGATGQLRNAIDLFPSAAMDEQGVLWCAWDCSEPRRCIRLARHETGANVFKAAGTFGLEQAVCSTPALEPAGELLLLAWSERGGSGFWQGKVALLEKGRPLATVTLKEEADVLFPQARRSRSGDYWVVYEKSNANGSEVVLRNISPELK